MSEKVINLRTDVHAPAAGGLGKVLDALRGWNERRIAKAELRAMPNHLLNDIGIRRELIDEYVDGVLARRVARVVPLDRGSRPPQDTAKAA